MSQCPGAHCSSISERVNKVCKDDGFKGNVVYVFMPDGTECYCNCSCLAHNTPVAISNKDWKPIQNFKVGDKVLVLSESKSWVETPVAFSNGTPGDGNLVPYTIFLETSIGTHLMVTPDHLFLLADQKLTRADRLNLSDKLLGADLKPVTITQLSYGRYSGGIHNISTSTSGPGEPLWNHLLNTAGVISGDFYAQLFLGEETFEPQIGSTEYEQKFGTLPPLKLSDDVAGSLTTVFSSYGKFDVPEGAVGFLPEWQKQAKPGLLRPLDNSLPFEMVEYLIRHFKTSYPNIQYHNEWGDNTVNAYAWIDSSGQRHVAILGGLARHSFVRQEGLGLVVAHEIGHHYGGSPTYPGSTLSCEGQADYWGASVAMRQVWFGEEYIRQVKSGAEQLYNLFDHGLIMSISNEEERRRRADSRGCGHPPAACRRDTYLAAARLDSKPPCAGIQENETKEVVSAGTQK